MPSAQQTNSVTPNVAAPRVEIYKDGGYLKKNPSWHIEESPFKAKYIVYLLSRNRLRPKTICEAGCGAGEVLRQLQLRMLPDCEFWGFDISPQAIEFARPRSNKHMHFELGDLCKQSDAHFDLLLVLDVVEHVEDCFAFLRDVRERATHAVFHLPLDISVQAVARKHGMMKRREDHAHLHYFTKDLALATLCDTGYRVKDWMYAPRSNEIGPHLLQKMFRVPRAAFFAMNHDAAVRVLGGYSLMVLTE